MLREKIAKFVQAHGYSYKGFVISTFLCPPAAVYIAFKKPDIGLPQRVFLGTVGLLAAPASTAAIGYVVSQLVGIHRSG